ncbi:MAG: hypothetical protein U0136_13155 [Bdellovibrionota bacterium]
MPEEQDRNVPDGDAPLGSQEIMRGMERVLNATPGPRSDGPAFLLRAMLDNEAELLQVNDELARFRIYVGGVLYELTAHNTGQIEEGAKTYRLEELAGPTRDALLAEVTRRRAAPMKTKDDEDFEIFDLLLLWLNNALGSVRQDIAIHC